MPRRGKPNSRIVKWAWKMLQAGSLKNKYHRAISERDSDFLAFAKGKTSYNIPIGYFISIIPESEGYFVNRGWEIDLS